MLRFMYTHKGKERARWNLCLAEGTPFYIKFGIHWTTIWRLFIARSNKMAPGLTCNIFKFGFLHSIWSELLTAPSVKQQISKIKCICLLGYVAMLYQLLKLCSPVRCSKVESGRACEDVILAYFKLLHIISSGEVRHEKYYMNHRRHSEDVSFP
jgi:hypothetical protein